MGLLAALGLAAAAELWARHAEPGRVPDLGLPRAAEDGIVLEPHPYLLWEHSPGEREEYGVHVRINRLGLRGPEPAVPKPAGVRRIVATGDSTVYGFGVPEEAMFVRVAAERLGGAGAGVEGWAAALPGYSTLQTLNLLRMRALALEPDLVVIANLWSDHASERQPDAALLDLYERYDRSLAGRLDRLLRGSALYRVLCWELGVRRGAEAAARRGWTPSQDRARDTATRVPLPDYRANVEAIVRLAHAHGAEVAFLILPHPDDIAGRAPGSHSYDAYREVLRRCAAGLGAVVVEGGTVLARRYAERPEEDPWLDRIHPSAAGQRALGEALAAALAPWAAGAPAEAGPREPAR